MKHHDIVIEERYYNSNNTMLDVSVLFNASQFEPADIRTCRYKNHNDLQATTSSFVKTEKSKSLFMT